MPPASEAPPLAVRAPLTAFGFTTMRFHHADQERNERRRRAACDSAILAVPQAHCPSRLGAWLHCTLGDAWRLWPHHSLYSAPQPPTLGDAHSAQMGGCGAAMRPSSSRRLHGQRISINESQEDKPMTKAELKQMEKEAFAEMKKLKDS